MINIECDLVEVNGVKMLLCQRRLGELERKELTNNGLFLADVRAENGDLSTAVLEKYVRVDFEGTVISHYAFDFSAGFIEADFNFLGTVMPVDVFCDSDLCLTEKEELCSTCKSVSHKNGKMFCENKNCYCRFVDECSFRVPIGTLKR